eukprot:364331-Chlamydomonas_euryale.AAC.4
MPLPGASLARRGLCSRNVLDGSTGRALGQRNVGTLFGNKVSRPTSHGNHTNVAAALGETTDQRFPVAGFRATQRTECRPLKSHDRKMPGSYVSVQKLQRRPSRMLRLGGRTCAGPQPAQPWNKGLIQVTRLDSVVNSGQKESNDAENHELALMCRGAMSSGIPA